jgi:hypothetical protein
MSLLPNHSIAFVNSSAPARRIAKLAGSRTTDLTRAPFHDRRTSMAEENYSRGASAHIARFRHVHPTLRRGLHAQR